MNKLRKREQNLIENGFQPSSNCFAEIWGLAAVAAGTVVAGVAGAAMSSSAQASAAQTAAGAQEQAAQLQANTSADVYNAQQYQNQPARVAGGEALQQEAYLLGLNPNLDISGDTAIAQINPQLGNTSNSGGLTWSGTGSNEINNQSGNGSLATGLGANSAGGYGSVNGTPASGNALNWGTAPQVGPGNNGYGSANTSSNTTLVTPTPIGTPVNAPGTATTQPVTGSTSTAQSLTPGSYNAFRGGTLNIPSNQNTNIPANAASPTGGNNINPISGTPNTSGTSGGYGSLSSVYNPSTFYNDPSYQFEMGQEQLASNKQEAASGGLYSTGAMDQALQYAQGLASTDYQNAFNRSQSAQNQQFNYLQALTGGGQVGTNNVTSAGTTAASNIGSAATGYGNASAAGTIGSANATTNAINQSTGFVTNGLNQYNNSVTAQNNAINSDPYAYTSTPPTGYTWGSNGGIVPVS